MTNGEKRIWIGGPPAGPGRVAWARRVAAARERLLVQGRRQSSSNSLHKDNNLRVVPRTMDLSEASVQTDHPQMKEGSAQTELELKEVSTQTEPLRMGECSTQTEQEGTKECSTQTEQKETKERSTQIEQKGTKECSTQTCPLSTMECSTQTYSRMTEASTQTENSKETTTQTVQVITSTEGLTVKPQQEESDEMVPVDACKAGDQKPSLKCTKSPEEHDNSTEELSSWDDDWNDWEEPLPTPDDQKADESRDTSGEESWHDDWDNWEEPLPSPDNQPAEGGLLGELTRRVLSSLPWVEAEPGAVSLLELGRGGYGIVDLVDYDGELLVRKRFYRDNQLDEAHALCLLDGAGGTPILRGVLKQPPTLFMTYCGCLTLEAFFDSRPERGRLLDVLVDLTQRVSEIHAKGLVHLDLKGENVMVRNTHTSIIDVGLAALPGQCVPFKDVDLQRVNWVCPQAARGGPVTYEADVYSLGRLLQQAQQILLGQSVSSQLALLASQALVQDPRRRPPLATLAVALRRLAE